MQQFAHYSLVTSHGKVIVEEVISYCDYCWIQKLFAKKKYRFSFFFSITSRLIEEEKNWWLPKSNVQSHMEFIFFFLLNIHRFLSAIPLLLFFVYNHEYSISQQIFLFICPFKILFVIFQDALYDLWPHWIACTSYSIPLKAIKCTKYIIAWIGKGQIAFSFSLSHLLTH